MVDACTGVIWANPMLARASRIHGDSGGSRESHERGFTVVSFDEVGAGPAALARDFFFCADLDGIV